MGCSFHFTDGETEAQPTFLANLVSTFSLAVTPFL